MSPGFVLIPLMLLSVCLSVHSTMPEILSFNQSAVAVAPNENVTFTCMGTGNTAFWFIENHQYHHNHDRKSYVLDYQQQYHPQGEYWFLQLTVQAILGEDETSGNNYTNISCVCLDNHLQHPAREDTRLIIATPPSNPLPHLNYSDSGRILTIAWDEPFTHPGFSVSGYTLQVINTSDQNVIHAAAVELNSNRSFQCIASALPLTCSTQEYIVTAFNEVGNSSSTITAGFPIEIRKVRIKNEVLYQLYGNPQLYVWFEPSNSCSFQSVHYDVYLEDSNGVSTLLNYSSDHHYTVRSELSIGANYTVVVVARSIAGETVSRERVHIQEQQIFSAYQYTPTDMNYDRSGECLQHILTHQVVTGVFATTCVVLLILSTILVCLLCKRSSLVKRRLKLSSTLTGTVATPTMPQRPVSLQTKCAATNPIYDGPLYESPGGEPLRTLLGSNPSTPSTPLDSPRYIFDNILPPSLPPPRKLSLVSNTTDTPDSTPDGESPILGANLQSDLPTLKHPEDEYTLMKPVSVRHGRGSKPRPSPLVIPSLTTLLEV